MIPCGIRGKAVTSLNVELGQTAVNETEVKEKLLKHFSTLFEAHMVVK
jgi:lipoyl(octanoyl) transferase